MQSMTYTTKPKYVGKAIFMETMHKHFCERLKARRLELGLSQRQAAILLNTDQGSYSKLENAAYSPNLSLVEKAARAFKMSIPELWADCS